LLQAHQCRQLANLGIIDGTGVLEFGGAGLVFDCHVFEFAGIENFSAFLALYKFRVLLTRNYTHARMLADLFHADSLGWKFSGLGSTHIPGYFWSGSADFSLSRRHVKRLFADRTLR